MQKKIVSAICFLLLALVPLISTMNAQVKAAGTIAGYVTDDTKGPLPGAVVTATSPTMPGSRQAISDQNGYYKFQSLPPGKFKIVVELDQFARQIYESIELNVGASLRLDAVLKPKTLTEKDVIVTAQAPQVETEKSTVDTVITADILNKLPILGRDFMSSIKILPGVVESAYGTSIAGGRSTDKNYNIDGSDNVDIMQGTMQSNGGYALSTDQSFMSFDQEAIQELSVGTGGYSADVGFGAGGLINVVTKSGSNQVHGSLYVQARNNKWDTGNNVGYRDWYYGGSISGPIIKDKFYFFLSAAPNSSSSGFDTRSYAYQDVPADLRDTKSGISNFLKLTYMINKSNILNVTANVPYSNYKSWIVLYRSVEDYVWMKYKDTGVSVSATETWMIGPNAVLDTMVNYGVTHNKTINQPGVHKGLVEDMTGEEDYYTGSYGGDADLERTKFNVSEKFTGFVDDWFGKHTIKAGAEMRYNGSRDVREAEEEYIIYPEFPPEWQMPDHVVIIQDAVDLRLHQSYIAGYLSDSWAPIKKLNINLGLRLSHNSFMPKYLLEPRFGFSYDVFGDGKTAIRGNFNLYYDRMNAYVQQLANYPLYNEYDYYDDGTIGFWPEGYRSVVIDPNIKYPRTTEWTVGIDRQLVRDLAVSVDYISRAYRNQLFTRYINLIDRETGERDDPSKGPLTYYSNFGYCDYKGLSVTLQKRYSHGYQFLLSYTFQSSKGNSSLFRNFSQLQYILGAYRLYKGDAQLADMDGKTAYDIPYAFKAFGSANLPFGFMMSGTFTLTAGSPYTDYNNTTREIVGEYQALRSPDLMNIDLRLEKDLKFRKVTMKLMADVFNLTNHENIKEVYANVASSSYGTPYQIGPSRRIQFGVRFEW